MRIPRYSDGPSNGSESRQRAPVPPAPPLFDAAVIGAGIVGVCCALSLQKEGLRVALLDRAGPGEGCSKGNAGHLAVEHISPLSSPATILQVPKMLMQANGPLVVRWEYLPKLLPWLIRFLLAGRPIQVAAATRAIAALNQGALAAYDVLSETLDLQELIRKEGTLLACESARGLAAARRESCHLSRHGIRSRIMARDELAAFDPALNPDLKGGLYFPDSAHVVDPLRLVQRLAQTFQNRGGQFVQANVDDIVADNGACQLITAGCDIRARFAVIAAGAWSRPLAAKVGHDVPLDTERGYHFMVLDPSAVPRVPTSSHEQRFVMTPMEHGLRIAGRVELGGLKLPMNPARATQLLPLARNLLPGLGGTRHETWMGFRPTLPDSLPVIDRAREFPQVLFAFGHHHLGLTQAAVTGMLIADLLAGRQPGIDLEPYRVERFDN